MNTLTTQCMSAGISTDRCFHSYFDRTAFSFSHLLHQAPEFRFPALMSLAERLSQQAGRFYIEEGQPHPGLSWGSRAPAAPLLESLASMEERLALVMLKRVQNEPGYRDVVEALTDDLTDMTGIDMRTAYRDPVMTILIASPGRITPYHIDGEANLLMQILGSKDIYIFDGNDREILPAIELEKFWTGDIRAASYKPSLQDRAWHFELEPGTGVTNPVIFPHWVRNGANVSVSVSINFKRHQDDLADAFRVNARMRRLGLHPSEPGRMVSVDHTKGMIYRAVRNAMHALEDLRHHEAPMKQEPIKPKAA